MNWMDLGVAVKPPFDPKAEGSPPLTAAAAASAAALSAEGAGARLPPSGGGTIACPCCSVEIGRWGWDEAPASAPGSGTALPTSAATEAKAVHMASGSRFVPRFAVLRRKVFANQLPSEGIATPRDSAPLPGEDSSPNGGGVAPSLAAPGLARMAIC